MAKKGCIRLSNATLFKMAGMGFEHPAFSSGKTGVAAESGAESGALYAREAQNDPPLRAIIDAWPGLPEAIKAGILAMVQAASNGG